VLPSTVLPEAVKLPVTVTGPDALMAAVEVTAALTVVGEMMLTVWLLLLLPSTVLPEAVRLPVTVTEPEAVMGAVAVTAALTLVGESMLTV